MTSRGQIEELINRAYVARVSGDLDGVMACFTDDIIFQINGRGTGADALSSPSVGQTNLRPIMSGLIQTYRFENREQVSLLVDGDRAALHWRAKVTDTTTGKSAPFDVFDFLAFRDGKISELRQSFDTALAMSLGTS